MAPTTCQVLVAAALVWFGVGCSREAGPHPSASTGAGSGSTEVATVAATVVAAATPDGAPAASGSGSGRAPAPGREVVFECGVDARHFGGHLTIDAVSVDLGAGAYRRTRIDQGPDDHTPPKSSPATPLTRDQRAALEALTDKVLSGTDWKSDPAVMDGMACSLDIRVPGAPTALAHVQRQVQNRHDAVDQLIVAMRALPAI